MKSRAPIPALSADDRSLRETERAARPDVLERLVVAQADRARQSLLRRLRTVEAADGAHVQINGRRLLNFASNDYLGLAQHPALREALVRALARWGVARLLRVDADLGAELERSELRFSPFRRIAAELVGRRPLFEMERALRKACVDEALARCLGNRTQAAELLGISRRTLLRRLDEYAVPRPRK